AFSVKADVSDEKDVKNLMKETLKEFGTIDILVNNAGITKDNLLMRMKESDFDDVVDTNLKGTFLCIKAVSRTMMKQRSGRIIKDRKSTRLNSSHVSISYAVFCLKKKRKNSYIN